MPGFFVSVRLRLPAFSARERTAVSLPGEATAFRPILQHKPLLLKTVAGILRL